MLYKPFSLVIPCPNMSDCDMIGQMPSLLKAPFLKSLLPTLRISKNLIKSMLILADDMNHIVDRGSRSLKLANRLDFIFPGSEKLLHIFVAHWPSRLWCPPDSSYRHALGMHLRNLIDDINREEGSPAYTVLLGDFNDEPYDRSLSEQLLAVRDRSLVRRNPELLYNPFWRHLGDAVPYYPGVEPKGCCGSCCSASSQDTHWRTFDQIIFSSAFLGLSDWHLHEKNTTILNISEVIPAFASIKIFDHYPVFAMIERKEFDG